MSYESRIDGRKTVIIGSDIFKVGVKTGNQVTITNEKGISQKVDEVIGEEIYNRHKTKHSNYLLIDFETGGRGWFPGCDVIGVLENDISIPLKEEENEESTTLKELINTEVYILSIIDNVQTPLYYYVESGGIKGYIYHEYITSIQYRRHE